MTNTLPTGPIAFQFKYYSLKVEKTDLMLLLEGISKVDLPFLHVEIVAKYMESL